jgi:hypothetical protein
MSGGVSSAFRFLLMETRSRFPDGHPFRIRPPSHTPFSYPLSRRQRRRGHGREGPAEPPSRYGVEETIRRKWDPFRKGMESSGIWLSKLRLDPRDRR